MSNQTNEANKTIKAKLNRSLDKIIRLLDRSAKSRKNKQEESTICTLTLSCIIDLCNLKEFEDAEAMLNNVTQRLIMVKENEEEFGTLLAVTQLYLESVRQPAEEETMNKLFEQFVHRMTEVYREGGITTVPEEFYGANFCLKLNGELIPVFLQNDDFVKEDLKACRQFMKVRGIERIIVGAPKRDTPLPPSIMFVDLTGSQHMNLIEDTRITKKSLFGAPDKKTPNQKHTEPKKSFLE